MTGLIYSPNDDTCSTCFKTIARYTGLYIYLSHQSRHFFGKDRGAHLFHQIDDSYFALLHLTPLLQEYQHSEQSAQAYSLHQIKHEAHIHFRFDTALDTASNCLQFHPHA